MISHRTLSLVLQQQLEEQLDHESEVLQRIEVLSASLEDTGLSNFGLAARQGEIMALVEDLLRVQGHRQELRSSIAADWGCSPGEVRLAVINLQSPSDNARLQSRRQELLKNTARADARLKTTRESLSGLHGIITDLLSAVLPSPQTDHVRYTASGQRVTPVHQTGIEMRS
ncbi:MAG TPA: hypothetical protein VNQ76_11625 [Planctomicrobium sp.]|nr:hypothetical protein [Planctomicrobium sp.]